MSTRREFLLNCSALLASASFAPTAALAARPRLHEVSLDQMSAAAFGNLLNTWFIVRDNSRIQTALQLAALEPADSSTEVMTGNRLESFSLFFTGDASQPLRQNTYFFEHASMGRFAMFIVPVGPRNESRCLYEAIFNRSGPESARSTRENPERGFGNLNRG